MAVRAHVFCCTGTGCVSAGSFDVARALDAEVAKRGLQHEVQVVRAGCQGFCAQGPIVIVAPDNIFYCAVTPKDAALIAEEHLLKGRPVKKLMFTPPEEKAPVPLLRDIPFFAKQKLLVLRNRGLIDPEKIEDYIAVGGYTALAKALTEMTPEAIIREVKRSGLRGRGGGGFPTGLKWEICRAAALARGEEPFVICNADEGDPGAFMDRSIIESDPQSVVEGMVIGAYVLGARSGYVYVRHEYPIARDRLQKAIEQARDMGLLGEGILGTSMSFDITVVRGGGAFVCGEETALMASIEGRLGEPRPKYVYPAERGLYGRPTVINNVETWANIPLILLYGADWFAAMGTGEGMLENGVPAGSKGTKVFSLVGKVNNTGLIEVPMGITLREIVFDIGGGILDGKRFKAVQTGGPSGGCLPDSKLDLPVDFDTLTEAGSMMGSGGMIVMDEDNCMVETARYFVAFLTEESCGKCTPCREGLRTSLDVLTRLTEGRGRPGDIEILEEIGTVMLDCCLCALGTTAPNPILSTIRYFREEYEAHIYEKRCPANYCKELIEYEIVAEKCDGCHACVKPCPTEAITGVAKKLHTLDKGKCIKCGACIEVCSRDAIIRVPRANGEARLGTGAKAA